MSVGEEWIAVGIGAAALIFAGWQGWLLRRQVRQQAQIALYGYWLDLSQFLVEHPELLGLLYKEEAGSSTEDIQRLALGMYRLDVSEVFFRFADSGDYDVNEAGLYGLLARSGLIHDALDHPLVKQSLRPEFREALRKHGL